MRAMEVRMDKGENYQALEDDFTSTFIRELMPGILHNFANPLNGIMGRSKLLQHRIDDVVKKIEERYPETAAALHDEILRIKNDIRSINKESDSFFEIFRDASGKFYALAARGEDGINLSQLLAAEMRFANFYLEFKHDICKDTRFDENLPDFKGNLAEWSMVLWRVIRFAMNRALASDRKEFLLETKYDAKHVMVTLQYTGDAVPDRDQEIILKYLKGDADEMVDSSLEEGVLLAVKIMKKDISGIEFGVQNGLNSLQINVPYRTEKV